VLCRAQVFSSRLLDVRHSEATAKPPCYRGRPTPRMLMLSSRTWRLACFDADAGPGCKCQYHNLGCEDLPSTSSFHCCVRPPRVRTVTRAQLSAHPLHRDLMDTLYFERADVLCSMLNVKPFFRHNQGIREIDSARRTCLPHKNFGPPADSTSEMEDQQLQ